MSLLSDWGKTPKVTKTWRFKWTGHNEERAKDKANRKRWAEEEAKNSGPGKAPEPHKNYTTEKEKANG